MVRTVMLKNIWVDSDRTREGNILALLRAVTNDEDSRQLVEKHFLTTICHGDVWTETDIHDDTANTLMRGSNIPQVVNRYLSCNRSHLFRTMN